MAMNAEVFGLVVARFFGPMSEDSRPLFKGLRPGLPGQTLDQTEEYYMMDLIEVARVCQIPLLTPKIVDYLKTCRIRSGTGSAHMILTVHRAGYVMHGESWRNPVDCFPKLSIGESWVDLDPKYFSRLWEDGVFARRCVTIPDLHGYRICIRRLHRLRYASGEDMGHLAQSSAISQLFPKPEYGETWETFDVDFIRRVLAENIPVDRKTTQELLRLVEQRQP